MRVLTLLQLVRFRESLFSLPFSLTGALLAISLGTQDSYHFYLQRLIFIIFAVIFLRQAAMCFNRVIDKDIDAINPRTQSRLLASGQLESMGVWVLAWLFSFAFVTICYLINDFCFAASPFLVTLAFFYSYCKRFTYWGHAILALIQFFGPFLAWYAITDRFSWAPVCLGLCVFFWIFAIDLIYQSQDLEHDRHHGLYNLPVLIGRKAAHILAGILQIISLLCLWQAGLVLDLSVIYFIGLIIASGIVTYQFYLLYKTGLESLDKVFFTCSSWFSICVFFFTLVSVLWNV